MDKVTATVVTQTRIVTNGRYYYAQTPPQIRFWWELRLDYQASIQIIPQEPDTRARYIQTLISKSSPKLIYGFDLELYPERIAAVVMAVLIFDKNLKMIPFTQAYGDSMGLIEFCFYTIEQIPDFSARACTVTNNGYVESLRRTARKHREAVEEKQ